MRPQRSRFRWLVVGSFVLLASLVGVRGAIRALEGPGRFAHVSLSGAAWRGVAPQSAGQGSLGPGQPVGRSGARLSQVRLGFWPLAMQVGGSPTPTATPSPTATPTATAPAGPPRRLWLPWAACHWP
ncbi:MAG: hypothetical protein ACUVXG_09725 [Anaerolineae bacterium]